MEKLPVVLVVPDADRLEAVLNRLKFSAVLVAAVLVERGDERTIEVGNTSIPTRSLSSIDEFLARPTDFVWLVGGSARSSRVREFLLSSGVSEDFIVDFDVRLNYRWLKTVENVVDGKIFLSLDPNAPTKKFFIVGAENIFNGIDPVHFVGARGVNVADGAQDIRQSFFTAKFVFDHTQSIAFALLGLTPHSLFAANPDNVQYTLVLKNFADQSVQGQLLDQLLNPTVEPEEPVDTSDLDPSTLETWKDTLDEITVGTRAEIFNRNLNALEDMIKLCLERGAKPIGVILPYAPIIRQHYPEDQLSISRQALAQLEKIYDFTLIDLFDVPLGYDCFRNALNLNPRGAQLISSLINFKLHNQGLLPFDELADVTYQNFYGLSALLQMDAYNKLMTRVFDVTARQLRRCEKIKIGFVLYDASMWCGDPLYKLFADNPRYEPTVFMCLRQDMVDEKNFVADFNRSVEQLRSRGLNVEAITSDDAPPPEQDVMICLMPYFEIMPRNFMLETWTARTLTCYIPYGMHISGDAHVKLPDYPIMTLAWKVFLDTRETLNFYEQGCRLGLPRGYYSGYPRMDYFYDEHDGEFEWKGARKNSVKIVYAPHWSIDNGIQYSTFHLNGRFIYEYAKSHPKTSWVFKPHPNLAYSAVSSGLFRSTAEYDEYVRRWERLPNARVVTGGYYQSIFASSDGMILDSGSFNGEYQYTHKPLLFLTRESQRFTDIGGALMEVLYRADGRDHKKIAAFIENVLIKGRDSMAETRRKFFDEHLNYRAHNGKSASEYIFEAIDKELSINI